MSDQVKTEKKTPTWVWILMGLVGVPVLMCTGALMAGGGANKATAPPAPMKREVSSPTQQALPVAAPAPIPVPIAAAPAAAPAGTFPGDGVFLVGKDIRPGTYRSAGEGTCYWARLSGLSGELDDMLANNLAKGAAVVAVKKTDKAFETKGCGTWSLVE